MPSSSREVPNPAGGRYWVMVQNWLTGQGIDNVDLAVAVVPGTDNGNLTVTGPTTQVAAGTPFDLRLAWNEPNMAVGDAWFALVEYGSDKQHPTNAGSLLVKLERTGRAQHKADARRRGRPKRAARLKQMSQNGSARLPPTSRLLRHFHPCRHSYLV